ncbi:MAG: M1 family metallopeptidase [Nocardioides sp.]
MRRLVVAAVLVAAMLGSGPPSIGAPGLAPGLVPGAVASAPASAGKAGSAGIGDPYFPRDGNGGYDVRRYSVHDTYRFASRRLSGHTVVRLVASQRLTRFNLDLLLPVTSVRIDGRAAAFDRPRRHELRITPRAPIPAGTAVRVKVEYAGYPDRLAYAGESNWLASSGEVVTMNEPHMAPWWFPANDHPRDKARFDLHLRVPHGNRVIANGRPDGRTRGPRMTTWHWRAHEPMATYLAFFAAGSFTVETGRRNGRPWLNAVSNRLSASARTASLSLLRETPRLVHWLEQQLGPYPFDTTGGVVTSLQPGFALENQTRPVYPYVGGGAVTLLVHELAHQWYGDDVSVHGWRDIWLNEGFATFLEVRYRETHGGQAGADWLRSSYDGYGAANSFWAVPVADPGPGRLFDDPVYYRGAMTLQALRNVVGESDFWAVMRTWAADHSRHTGSTEQFRALAEEVSGQDLAAFFDAWLVSPPSPPTPPRTVSADQEFADPAEVRPDPAEVRRSGRSSPIRQ